MVARRSLRSAILLVAACSAAGCARVPALRSVLATHFYGYDQVLPASEALPDEKRYEYLPGNIAAFTLTAPRSFIAAASWSSESDYCSANIALSQLRPRRQRPVLVVHNFDFSLRRALHEQKAVADLQLEPNEFEILRRVEIRITSPREYTVQNAPKPDYVSSCIAAMAGRSDAKRIRSILVGNVSVKVLFKDNVGPWQKTAVLNKLQSNLGLSFLNGVAEDLSASNVVFAARLGAVNRK
jgi:hypothetical protein